MQERTKAQITIGLLAFFASMWILIEQSKNYSNPIYTVGLVIVLFNVMFVLSYVIIAILDWINIFDLKTNAAMQGIAEAASLAVNQCNVRFHNLINNTGYSVDIAWLAIGTE